MNAVSERTLPVGHGLFDPLTGELALDGRTVKLRPRTAALLAHLLRHPGRTVGKDELLQAVWPDAVVTDDSLVQCVKEIRQALGESGRDWIRTLPRQGYAFVGNTPDRPTAPEPQPAPLPPPANKRVLIIRTVAARWRELTVLAVVAFAVAGALATHAWRKSVQAPSLSIVVMPVANQTGNAAHDNVADEMTESLTDVLARTPGMTVIAPGTAFTFKAAPVDVRRIGTLLNVRYVLEGSLRLDESRPVLTMRLADSSTAVQMWNQEFRPAAIPELRDLVAGRVADTLGVQLIRAETGRSHAVSPRALELLAQARALLRWSGKGSSVAQARRLVEEALRIDPGVAELWGALAYTYLAEVRFSASHEAWLQRAEQAVQRALALKPDSDGIRYLQGWLHYEQAQIPEALAAFDLALQLNPNNAGALAFRGAALGMLGRSGEGLAAIEQAMRISPRDPQLPSWQMFAGTVHLHLGQDRQAVESLTRSVEGAPMSPFSRLFLASALGLSGRIPEAQVQLAQFQHLRPGFTIARVRALERSDAPAFREQRERVYEGLRRAGMPE